MEVVEGVGRTRYQLAMDGVTGWHLLRDVPLPWDYAELTEVHVTELDDEVFVEMVLWTDDTSLRARCTGLRVDPLEWPV